MPSAAMRARQHDVAVEVAGDRRHRGIGEVIGRHVHRLDRGDRGAGDRGDAFLQRRHFGGQRRLVADARGQPAQQAGDLAAGLHEAEHVVDQQQHVLVLLVAEILGDGERGRGRRASGRRAVRSSGRYTSAVRPSTSEACMSDQQFMALA